jgi:prophage tail gpP-like protein
VVNVGLRVNGREYRGWKSIRVTRSIESISGSFELSVSERWSGLEAPWPIVEEDACELAVNGVPVITGYVDKRSLEYGPEDHSLTVSGRDRAGQLVDCSAVLDSWEFKGINLLTLAERLAKPFGIKVSVGAGVNPQGVSLKTGKRGSVTGAGATGKAAGLKIPNPPSKFTVNPGDSAFEILERACRQAGILPVSDGAGGLVLTRSGTERTATRLVQGVNILKASADFDASARYSRYVVRGQSPGRDDWFGKRAAAVSGEAKDLNVRRSERMLLIRPESAPTPDYARNRAQWEAKVRAARADTIRVTVQGWQQGNGELWPINALAPIRSPLLGVDGDMLITETVFSLDDSSGSLTQITLRRPDAFLPEPTVTNGGGSPNYWDEIKRGV